jgi:four helix bundle protein
MSDSQIRSYRDLDGWRVAMSLAEVIYGAAKKLPVNERFELSSQMRRASVSVPSNITEGQACGADGRYIYHLRIALGSLGELGTHLELARRLAMLPNDIVSEAEEHLARSGQVLYGLLRARLRKRRVRVSSAFLAAFGLWLCGFAVLG